MFWAPYIAEIEMVPLLVSAGTTILTLCGSLYINRRKEKRQDTVTAIEENRTDFKILLDERKSFLSDLREELKRLQEKHVDEIDDLEKKISDLRKELALQETLVVNLKAEINEYKTAAKQVKETHLDKK